MQVRFRLAEILEEFRDTGRGTIKKISDATGLERHQVSALLKSDVQYLSLNSLGAICDYLINAHHISRYELPGRLFTLEAEGFWKFLSEKQSLVMSFGVRQEMHETGVLWVPAADSYLQGILLHELYGTETPQPQAAFPAVLPPSEQGPRFEQCMVRSCSAQSHLPPAARDGEFQQMKREAITVYEKFHAIPGNKALVCLGSIKSNGLCELVISGALSTAAWVSQDEVPHPGDRVCPFYFRYRDFDVNVPSCHGGKRLAQHLEGEVLAANAPGIYFERAPGEWDVAPWSSTREPALIFYNYKPPTGVVEVVLGGFSTEGTFLLAQHFPMIVREIWPPEHITPAQEAAAFVVDFHVKPKTPPSNPADGPSDLGSAIRQVEQLDMVRLPKSVLSPRFSHRGVEE